MFFLVFIIVMCFFSIYIIENFFDYLPKTIQEFEHPIIQKFFELGVLFLCIFFSIFLLDARIPEKIRSFHEYHNYWYFVILAYIVLSLYAAIKKGKKINLSIEIYNVDEFFEHPVFFLEYTLIDYQHILLRQEQALLLLKTFSPIPFILLLTDSISFLIDSVSNNLDQSYLEYLNIGAIVFLFIYIYTTYKQYSSYQETLFIIKTIKRKIYFLEHSNLYQKKRY